MRLPRFHFRVRTLLALVVLIALALVGRRIYHDGPEAHWLLLKLRHGGVEARRSAAREARDREGKRMLHDLVGQVLSGPATPQVTEQRRSRARRRAAILLPALVQATIDPDERCRANALEALGFLASFYGTKSEKRHALHHLLIATNDRNDSVRTAAVGSLAGLAEWDVEAVVAALRSALSDPSVEVRQTAARELGMLGVSQPKTQPEVARILEKVLASREDPRVRIKAAWGMCYFGVDQRRHPPGSGPDVVTVLIAALSDPEIEVRQAAAIILGSTTDIRGRPISSWARRKAMIIPALEAAIADNYAVVREESALALFSLGQRDLVAIELIEQAAHDPARSQKARFESALSEWQSEQETEKPVEPGAQGVEK